MSNIPTPEDEAGRLRELRSFGILDTAAEEGFDRITRILARSLGVQIALVSLIDTERQWFKSRVGLEAQQTPRNVAFCSHAICEDSVTVVRDATADQRFATNPLVTGNPQIRFYAGAPLRTKSGHNMGTLCAIDTKPRELSTDEKALLEDLAGVVVDEMEMHRLLRRAELAEARLIDAVEALPDGFVLYDENDRLVLCNQRYKEIYSESAPAIEPGTTFEEIIRFGAAKGQYPDAIGREEEWISERLESHCVPGTPIEQELPGDRWLRIQERRTRDGGHVGFRVDITELKRQRRELSRLAGEDCLTGALNRRRFLETARSEMGRAKRYGGQVGLLLLDVDHFKVINDTYGHAAGDHVLKTVVERWQAELRDSDCLGRIGGEEFAVILPQTDAAGSSRVAERLRQVTATDPIDFDGKSIDVSVSAGLTLCDRSGENLESALARADDALYQAKEAGRDRFVMCAA